MRRCWRRSRISRRAGIGVTLYPIVLMDIPGTATRWGRRGLSLARADHLRPTRRWAPAAVTAQVAAFAGTGSDWRFRRMVLHYAGLAVAAGGVDALIIGSEMRGMTFLRDGGERRFRSSRRW